MVSSVPFQYPNFEYSGERQYSKSSIKSLTLLVSARPASGDSETSSGGGVNQQPAPWLLVPRPVAGVERLRADRDYEALMNWIQVQTRVDWAELSWTANSRDSS